MSKPGNTYSCPACKSAIVRKHYRQHLTKSSNPACNALLSKDPDLLPDNNCSTNAEEDVQEADPARHSPRPILGASGLDCPPEREHDGLSVDPLGDRLGNYEDMNEFPDQMEEPNEFDAHETSNEDIHEEYHTDAENALGEKELEPTRPFAPQDLPAASLDGSVTKQSAPELQLQEDTAALPQEEAPTRNNEYRPPHIVHYGRSAGSPVPLKNDSTSDEAYQSTLLQNGSADSIYYPFLSKLEWEFAKWAKLHGSNITASAVTDLLSIDGVPQRLGLSFKNSKELNKVIDCLPAQRPAFKSRTFGLGGEVFEVYYRDILSCIKALFNDPEFAPYLKYAPEQHYTDDTCSIRLFHDLHTGDWWWATQEEIDKINPGGTIVPIILSSDKTQLTLFRNKSAYPLYMTIGNIPKEIRRRPSYRAYVLLAYLPTSRFQHISNQAARRRSVLNVYHSCMSDILAPLKEKGLSGINMANGNGVTHRTHPLYASFIGDYPEQVQAACVLTGDCPECPCPNQRLEEYDPVDAATSWRSLNRLLDALDVVDKDPSKLQELAKELRVKPVINPFWKDLPFAHIYRSITPDVLHQLYQGIVKHLVAWVTAACGAAEIDARCRRFPPNHNVHLFIKGISSLSRVSGKEHASICQILLGLVLDIPLADGVSNIPLQQAVRAILDFVFLAQYPVHSAVTLRLMEAALTTFHQTKHVFVSLGIREHFNIPKLHFATHYVRCIRLFGTTDNFNTEYTERLHIDLAKDAYRATNHKDEYSQMTTWLERKEKMAQHARYIDRRLKIVKSVDSVPHLMTHARSYPNIPGLDRRRFLHMAKHPTASSVSFEQLQSPNGYGAVHFLPSLYRFIILSNQPNISRRELDVAVESTFLPCRYLRIWHSIKYLREDPLTLNKTTADIIHAHPATKDSRGRRVPARFDTVLVNEGSGAEVGVRGRRVGRVRVVFSLSPNVIDSLFLRPSAVPQHLVYIEWFTPFQPLPDRTSGLYKVSKSLLSDNTILSSVVPLSYIYRSVHLFPKFGPAAPILWSSSNVLDKCETFYLNPFTDRHLYIELQGSL